MKAVRLHDYGATPLIEDAAVPTFGPDDILVRVEAAALNPLDVKMRTGRMHDYFPVVFPYTLGTDLAGVVAAVGADVTGWGVGDAVVARTDPPDGGAFGELARVPATHLVRRPGLVGAEQAAGLATAASTAYQALFEVAKLEAGQTVLVHAGAGGVGGFAIQLARHAGARVIATASGDGLALVRRLGADRVIDYKAQPFEDGLSDVDVVLDTVGGDTQQRSFGVLRAGGHLVAITAPPDEALAKAHGVSASFVFHSSDAARLAKVVDMVAAGTLEVVIDRTVPMGAFGDAFAYQAAGHARGKIIVTPER